VPADRQARAERDIGRTTGAKRGALTTRAERALQQRKVSLRFGIRSVTFLRKREQEGASGLVDASGRVRG
jgi:hypothetical protein